MLLTSGKPGIVSGGCSSKVIEKDDAPPRRNVAVALVHGQPPLALMLYATASAELSEMLKLIR